MQTSALILLLAGAVAVLAATVGFLIWRISRKNDELRQKNEVIIHEIRRNQAIIDKAVSHGVSRASLL